MKERKVLGYEFVMSAEQSYRGGADVYRPIYLNEFLFDKSFIGINDFKELQKDGLAQLESHLDYGNGLESRL